MTILNTAAIRAGCTSIEHGDFLDDETLTLMAQKGTYLDPNFLVLHNYLDDRSSFNMSAKTAESLACGTGARVRVGCACRRGILGAIP